VPSFCSSGYTEAGELVSLARQRVGQSIQAVKRVRGVAVPAQEKQRGKQEAELVGEYTHEEDRRRKGGRRRRR